MFPLKLVGELIAVRMEEPSTGSAILLPDWKRSLLGTVLAKGHGAKNTEIGDRVSFGAAVGMDSVYNGVDVRILKEEDLDAIYDNEA